MNTTTGNTTFSTKSLVTMALFAAILCVSAYISIPLPNGSHITFLNFVLFLIALIFSTSQSTIITLIWFFLGLIGVPVFVGGQAGMGYITSQWGGYNFAFIAIAILLPLFRKLTGDHYQRLLYTAFAVLGAVLIDVIGSLWLMYMGSLSLQQAFVMGFLPFILLDLVKAVVSAQIVPQFRRLLQEDSM